MKKLAMIAAVAALATGCATQTAYVNGSTVANTPATPTYNQSQKFWVGGIGQERVVNAAEVCAGAHKVAKVESKQEAKDVLFGAVTLGIYTPRTAKVYCK